MLDLRGTNSAPKPAQQPVAAGVPTVGANDVSFTPAPRRSSPILETGSAGPGKTIQGVGAGRTNDPIVMVVALVSVALAGVTGLVASYLSVQQASRLTTATNQYDSLVAQRTTGTTGDNLKLIETTAAQLTALQGATATSTPWAGLLDVFASQVPGAIQLKSSTFDSRTSLVTITGSGNAYEDVAHLAAALGASDRFKDVALQSAASVVTDTSSQIDFSLAATYVPVAPAAQAAASGTGTATQGATQ